MSSPTVGGPTVGGPTFGEQMYSGLGFLGKFETYKNSIIGGLCVISIIVIAVYFFKKDESNLVDVTANITKATCIEFNDTTKKKTTYNCTLDITYNIQDIQGGGNKEVSAILNTYDVSYSQGGKINITYDKNDPTHPIKKVIRLKWVGIGLSIIACLCVVSIIIDLYLVNKSPLYAAAKGAGVGFAATGIGRGGYGGGYKSGYGVEGMDGGIMSGIGSSIGGGLSNVGNRIFG